MRRLTDKERELRLKIGSDERTIDFVAADYKVTQNHVRWCRRMAIEAGLRSRKRKGVRQPFRIEPEKQELRLKIGTTPGTRKEVAEQYGVPITFVKFCRNLAVKAGLRKSPGFSKPKAIYRDSMRFPSVDAALAATPKSARRGVTNAANNQHKYKGYHWRWAADVNSGLE